MAIIAADMREYVRLPSYNYMMRKWWIWDVTKFLDITDDTEERENAKRKALGLKLLGRTKDLP